MEQMMMKDLREMEKELDKELPERGFVRIWPTIKTQTFFIIIFLTQFSLEFKTQLWYLIGL